MSTDSQTPKIAAALVELQAQLPRIVKGETADTGKYKYDYAGLSDITDQVLPLLAKLGMAWVCRPTIIDGAFVLAYELLHVSGESRDGAWPISKGTPQDMGGQITYARRYCLLAVTGVAPANDDDDAVNATAAATKRSSRAKAEPTPDGPTRANGEQMAKMGALFTKLGLVAQADKLKFASQAIDGRAIKSATDLTMVEADKVIAALTARAAMADMFAETDMAGDEPAQLRYACEVVGRSVGSLDDLSEPERTKLTQRLASWMAQDDPSAESPVS